MKKIITFLFVATFAGNSFAQESFHEDSRNFDIKLDFAGYSGTVQDNHTDSIETSSAAAVALTPQMAWALGRAISLGGSLTWSYYLNASSSSSQLNGLDANLIFDIHFLRLPKTDMMLGFKLGCAGIRLDPHDGTGDVYGSMGLTGDIHLMARFYISNRLAIIANLGLPGYTFNKFGKNLNDTFTIKLGGFFFGTGIAMKLLNQRTAGTQRHR